MLLVLSFFVCAIRVSGAPVPAANTFQTIEIIRQKHSLPALDVVVVKDGQVCDRAAMGVRKSGDSTPVTTNDLLHIGSCTKAMTATPAAMLIEEGKLRWDSKITDVIPELVGKMDKQYEALTVAQLLSHRACRR